MGPKAHGEGSEEGAIERIEPLEYVPSEGAGPRAAESFGDRTHATDERWPRPVLIFAVAVGVLAVHAADPLRLDRSAILWLVRSGLAVAWTVGAVALFRRCHRVTGGVLAVLLGAVAVGVGVGNAGLHFIKVGFSETSYMGLATLAAGLGLVVLGAALTVAGARGWRKLLVLPLVTAAFVYLLIPLMIAVYVTHVPPIPMTGLTPADKGLPYREVSMRTTDGVRLAGWYVPSRNRASVVVLHGSGSNRSHMLDHLTLLARQGFGVLAVDARGHGQSEGVGMDLGWWGVLDVRAAVSFLARQPDVDRDRIGVYGMSMGGVEALTAAAVDPRIGAVVSEGASVSSLADASSLGVAGWLRLPFDWVTLTAADLLSPAEATPPLAGAVNRIAPRPVLLISGEGITEAALNRRYSQAARATTELWELPDTPHSHGLWKHRSEWSRRVGGFLRDALLG